MHAGIYSSLPASRVPRNPEDYRVAPTLPVEPQLNGAVQQSPAVGFNEQPLLAHGMPLANNSSTLKKAHSDTVTFKIEPVDALQGKLSFSVELDVFLK